jgi:uroporphyrinogen decarboxylase
VGDDGQVIAGELYSPLKLLHLVMGPIETTYLLHDHPERARELLGRHEVAMLDLVRQLAGAGVRVVMAMDNLDTTFHPPRLVEQCSASFYEQASRLCHASGSLFFIHACGRQRANLARIAAYGVDGLEGVAFPPLGDVELDEAMRLSGDRMILSGGISATEFQRLHTREEVFGYVNDLFQRMKPFAHRFILSASCATPYTAPWETLLHFRDAWWEYGTL